LKGLKVLLVDDNEDVASALAFVLELRGHQAFKISNGADAIKISGEISPDLTILDIGLPDLDGYEVCRRMRTQAWSQGKMIVALSAWGSPSDKEKAIASGFNKHFTKPMSVAVLYALLASVDAAS
jgi:DNA-binding response OmpR family regulator